MAAEDGRLLVWTAAGSWKVRRIKRDGHVRVTPCSATGKPHGEAVEAEAVVVEETGRVQQLLAAKYGVTYRLVRAFTALNRRVRRQPAEPAVTVEIRPGVPS